MNTLFWIICAALVLIAILLVVVPIWRSKPADTDDSSRHNLQFAQQRLLELKQQLQNSELSQAQYDEQYQELQLALRDDLSTDTKIKQPAEGGRWIIPLLLVMLPLLSLSLYAMLGDMNALRKQELQQTQQDAANKMQAMIAQIIERLKQNPMDLEGWQMLGRAYAYVQDYPHAAEVFAKLMQLQPNDVSVQLNYANSMAMARGGKMIGEPAQLVYKVLQAEPENGDALWLAGMAKVEEGDISQAMAYWKTLAAQLPVDSDGYRQVQQVLAEISAQPAPTAATAVATKIQIAVAIDPAIQAQAKPDQTVFIYAQALNGPKMPLAIVRKTVAELPQTVVLDDSMAMRPDTHLADFKQLKIIARISKTGNASTQAGDLIGSAEITVPAEKPVSVLINQAVN